MLRYFCLTALAAAFLLVQPIFAADDPYLWLEEIDSDAALDWVKARNAESSGELEAVPQFASIHARNLEIYHSAERIPSVVIRGEHLYNFWRDDKHVRGIWRRTNLAQYRQAAPQWETIIDVDALAAAENESWVWMGPTCLAPEYRVCMIGLSRGGADAVVRREFDTVRKEFVTDGFVLPEAKSEVSWKDADTIWVATDLGAGSLTTSGYPRVAKEWRRGTPITAARTVFEGLQDDVGVMAYSRHTPEGRYDIAARYPSIFEEENFIMLGGRLVRLDLPSDAWMRGFFKDHMLVSLRSDWTVAGKTYPQAALLAIKLDAFLRGNRKFDLIFEPSEKTSLRAVSPTSDRLLLTVLDNVRGRLWALRCSPDGWQREQLTLPGLGQVRVTSTADNRDMFFFKYQDSLTPSSLWLIEGSSEPVKVKSEPDFFDPAGMKMVQYEATSADGTKVPYFVVLPKGFVANGSNPTMLYGYGGFEISTTPYYRATWGSAWLERGGVAVLANIRGGGEFGPRWHQAALKANRHKSFEDFIAIAEDLVARKITSTAHLGIMGGSNGGLLVAAVLTQRPDLFKAVVCAAPLIDMKRYHKLLAGASWMSEYGDPDKPEEWAFIKTWSPYHNLKKDAGYTKVLLTSSTRDDRVHPAHARKMAAKMLDLGYPVFLYENIEGGHSGAADENQRAYINALEMAYLWLMLGN